LIFLGRVAVVAEPQVHRPRPHGDVAGGGIRDLSPFGISLGSRGQTGADSGDRNSQESRGKLTPDAIRSLALAAARRILGAVS